MRNLTNISAGVLHVPQLLHEDLQLFLRTLRESQPENVLEGFRIHLSAAPELVDDLIVVITDNLRRQLFNRIINLRSIYRPVGET